jgi:galactokinase
MNALFTSTIPAASGVSSSAALIVSSTLAFLVVNDKLSSVTKGDLIDMTVGNEKKVGTNRWVSMCVTHLYILMT